MKTSNPRTKARELFLAFLLSLFATMMAFPASADIPIPSDPLTTGARVPPNVLFLLDDSGSMAFDALPADSISDSSVTNSIRGRSALHNTLYYDPAKSYSPWVGADGRFLIGGTQYDAAYGDFNLASGGTIDLQDSGSCRNYNRNNNATSGEIASGTRVCGGIQTFYVPKSPSVTDTAAANFYRYQILEDLSIWRGEWGAGSGSGAIRATGFPKTNLSILQTAVWGEAYPISVPASATNLTVTLSGDRRPDLYLQYGSIPTESSYFDRNTSNSTPKTISVANPDAGTWYVRVRAPGLLISAISLDATYTLNNRCDGGTGSGNTWINCVRTTPNAARNEAQERQNYATWFSYHRTRMKAAKAGASAAFDDLGSNVRVGFRTIWGRTGSNSSANWPTQAVPIPVNFNDGLFLDQGTNDNRSKWFQRLHETIGFNGTPLHGALHQAGQYFSSNSQSGPYGPAAVANQLSCRQNFSILTTDGYWNDTSTSFPSNAAPRNNQDGTAGVSVLNPLTGEMQNTYTPSAPYRDGYSTTLADVAMYYWKNDLRNDLSNTVPTTNANPAFWQHMVTFGIAIGLKGQTGFESVAQVPRDYTGWPDPINNSGGERIDDLLHAAVNSRGTFLSASNPDEFTEGLRSALAAIVERVGSFSNVSSNSTSLDAGNRIFQASYVSGVWTGALTSSGVSATGVSVTPVWRATIPSTGRRVFSSNGRFPASLTDAQSTSLARTGSGSFPVSGNDNAAYIVGDTSREIRAGGTLRNRNALLGDIVGSSPAYVAETGTVYVGANDGMLHAFNASNGNEEFAFIPSGIDWSALGTLSRPDYAHRYFVDGPVIVSNRAQTPGKNVLVATLGKGGKGLFALDVTTPGSFDETKVKWQHYETLNSANAPTGNMGLIQGAPIIAKVRNGANSTKTVAIVGNGVNSTNQRAVLLVYDLEDGTLIREIDTGAGGASSSNGLSGPVGWDADNNGVVDYVYAGDMLGNVWKFDLTNANPTSWSISNAAPMFVATDASGNRQPITSRLTVALHPSNFSTWVFFGTGRFMTIGDVQSGAVQSFYGIRDDGVVVQRASLQQRSTVHVGSVSGRPVRAFERYSPLPLTKAPNDTPVRGWYINLLEPPNQSAVGERVISEVQIVNRVFAAASIIPMSDACQSDGRGYFNAFDAFTGTSLSAGSYFDIDGDGDFADEIVGPDNDKLPVGSIDLGVGMPTLPNLIRELAVAGGSTGGTGSVKTLDSRFTGRVSWREEVRE